MHRHLPGLLLTLALALGAFLTVMPELLLHPNLRVPVFGGDGLLIHYNLAYHARHGDGPWLTAQYHPHRESIFMTDAQSLVAMAVSGLRDLAPGLAEQAVGVADGILFWSNLLTALLLYLVLVRMGSGGPVAAVLSVAMALMAPPLLRQMIGHYGLGYAFGIPAVLLFLFDRSGGAGYRWRAVAVGALLLGLGLLHPYNLLVGAALLVGTAAVGWLLAERRWPAWGLVGIVPVGLLYLFLKWVDEVPDRVGVPYGFFKNISREEGLFSSPRSPLSDPVQALLNYGDSYGEWEAYLGLIPLLTAAVVLPTLLSAPARERLRSFLPHRTWAAALGGSVLGMLFSFGMPLNWFPDFSYDHLGALLQFRVPTRFAWPLYYVLGTGAAAVLAGAVRYYWSRRKLMAVLLLLPVAIWGLEAYLFAGNTVVSNGNWLRQEKLEALRPAVTAADIDTTRFSGIYGLPTQIGWTDKIHHSGQWLGNMRSLQLSLLTGLPLINGKLSRNGLGRAVGAVQLVGSPLIYPELVDLLPDDRALLVLASRVEDLSPGEQALSALGDSLYGNEEFYLSAVYPEQLRRRYREATAIADSLTAGRDVLRFIDYETEYGPALVGTGNRQMGRGEHLILADTLTGPAVELELSLWTWTDLRRFGAPRYTLRLYDASGGKVLEQSTHPLNTYDAYGEWLRSDFRFTLPPGAVRYELRGNYETEYRIDAVLLRRADQDVLLSVGDQRLLNGFPLRAEE